MKRPMYPTPIVSDSLGVATTISMFGKSSDGSEFNRLRKKLVNFTPFILEGLDPIDTGGGDYVWDKIEKERRRFYETYVSDTKSS